jgi:hypothetical protein
MEPASIRTKNPGAMWGRTGKKPTTFFETPQGPHGVTTNAPIPLKWGSTKTIYLSDGLGQDNNIAIFDTWVQGICAQIDLWREPRYHNKKFSEAIATWAGGNNVPSYIALVKQKVPGMTGDTIMDDKFWSGPMAVPFLKAQSSHEAGKTYPTPDADWITAQKVVFGGAKLPSAPAPTTTTTTIAAKPKTSTTAKAAGGVVVAGTVAAGIHQGWDPKVWILAAFIIIGLGTAFYLIRKKVNS